MKIMNLMKLKTKGAVGLKASAPASSRRVHALHSQANYPADKLSEKDRKKQRKQNRKKLEKIQKQQLKKDQSDNTLVISDFMNQLVPRLMILSIVSLVLVVASQFFSWTAGMLSQPVEVVEVQGDFKYLSKESVSNIVNAALSDGYLELDLPDLHDQLASLPWVEAVYLRRKMNSALQIEIIERKPLAFWNETYLVSDKAVQFKPKQMPNQLLVPKLKGLDLSKTLGLYESVSEKLPKEFLPLMAFSLDYDGSVEMRTSNDVVVILEQGSLDEQIERFKVITQHALASRLVDVEKIDVRYSNGAAVSWKQQAVVSIGR